MSRPIEIYPGEIRDVDPVSSYVLLTDGRSLPRGRVIILAAEVEVVSPEEPQSQLDAPERIV